MRFTHLQVMVPLFQSPRGSIFYQLTYAYSPISFHQNGPFLLPHLTTGCRHLRNLLPAKAVKGVVGPFQVCGTCILPAQVKANSTRISAKPGWGLADSGLQVLVQYSYKCSFSPAATFTTGSTRNCAWRGENIPVISLHGRVNFCPEWLLQDADWLDRCPITPFILVVPSSG